MATITLYENKINTMSGLFKEAKSSVKGLKTELTSFKRKCSGVNRSICNLDDVISSISASTQTQEEKINSLEKYSDDVKEFASDVARIDDKVADMVNKNKDDFYDKYNYLKPESEKDWKDRAKDWLKSAGEWCKENWQSICNLILTVVAIVAIVALSVATFGAAAVIVAAVVGAALSFLGQLISDIVSFIITGDWDGTWQSYLGAVVGGAVGSILVLTGNVSLGLSVESGLSTFLSQNLENITGGTQRSNFEIWAKTAFDAGTAAFLGKGVEKGADKAGKLGEKLFKNFPKIKRASGRGSYDAAYKMVLTKLKNGQIKNVSIKTFRNGILASLLAEPFKNVKDGVVDAIKEEIKEGYAEWKQAAQN